MATRPTARRAKGKKSTPGRKPILVGQRRMGRVLITGASAGIGAELAREFARHAHDLVLVARSQDRLDALAGELNAAHDTDTLVIAADLSTPAGVDIVIDELKSRNFDIDILVNNAGIIDVGPFADASHDRLQQLIALNIAAMTSLTSRLLPPMISRRFGRILNVASLAGFQPIPALATYAASKAYVLSFTEALAEELRGSGVRLTALCPGLTDTSMVAEIRSSTAAASLTPSFLVSKPADVARQAYAALMSGQVVLVPGLPNQVAATWSRLVPRWVTRTVTGFAMRQAEIIKSRD